MAGGPSIGGSGPNVKQRLLNSPVNPQIAEQLWKKKILSTCTIGTHDFKILLKVYPMATSKLLPDISALLDTGADSNIIDFQFAVDHGFVFKLIV